MIADLTQTCLVRAVSLPDGPDLAVLADADGLLLAVAGQADGDVAAASAAEVARLTERHLALVAPGALDGMLAWTDTGCWYLARVPGVGTLLLRSAQTRHPGALRLAARGLVEPLRHAMGVVD